MIIENMYKRQIRYIEIKNNSTAKYKMIENIKRMLGPGWVPGLRGRKDFFCTGEEKQADSRNLSSI